MLFAPLSRLNARPLTLTLSPQYGGEGTRALSLNSRTSSTRQMLQLFQRNLARVAHCAHEQCAVRDTQALAAPKRSAWKISGSDSGERLIALA